MGFPFKFLDVALLRTVFFILFPLCPGCYSPEIEFLRAYTKRAELVYAYMGICRNDTHNIMSSSPLLHLINPPPLSSAAVIRGRPLIVPLSTLLPSPASSDFCRRHLQSSEMGRALVLDGHRSLGLHNNEQNDGVDAAGEERVGRMFLPRFGQRIERLKKN